MCAVLSPGTTGPWPLDPVPTTALAALHDNPLHSLAPLLSLVPAYRREMGRSQGCGCLGGGYPSFLLRPCWAPLASDPPVSSSSTSPLISAARMRRASITSISITSICFFSASYWVCRGRLVRPPSQSLTQDQLRP